MWSHPDYKDPRRTGEGCAGQQVEPGTKICLNCVPSRAELMVSMGYTLEEIQDSLVGQRYNEVMGYLSAPGATRAPRCVPRLHPRVPFCQQQPLASSGC